MLYDHSLIKSFTPIVTVDGVNCLEISVEHKNNSYTTGLSIVFGNKSHNITSPGNKESFKIPIEWLEEIPSSDKGTGKIELYTFDNTFNQVGSTDIKYFTVLVPETIKPQISNISVVMHDKFSPVDYAIYGMTKPEIRAMVTPNTSPIKKYNIFGGGIDVSGEFNYASGYEGYNFWALGTVVKTWSNTKFTLTVEDERGRKASITSDEIYVQSYNRPLINNLSAYCFMEKVKEQNREIEKYYIRVNASAAPSPIKNSDGDDINTLVCYIDWKEANGSYSHFTEINNKEPYIFEVNKDLSYEIKFVVRDKYLETEAYCNVIGESKDFNIVDGGGGAAIGTKAAKEYFDVAYNSRFQKGIIAEKEVKSNTGLVSTGTGSKGDFLSFGEANRIETIYHTVNDEETGSSYIVVDVWGDFNECTEIGLYCVWSNAEVKADNYYKILNAPCQRAGTLRVYYGNGSSGKTALSRYIIQEYVTYDGGAVYRRCGTSYRDNESVNWGNWQFGSWYCYAGVIV